MANTNAAKKEALASTTSIHAATASDKGGVGKSFWDRFKIEFLRKLGKEVAAFDTDGGTGSLARILGQRDQNGDLLPPEDQDALVGVKSFNIRKHRTRDEFLNTAALSAAIVQLDLPGGGFDALSEIADGGGESLHGVYQAVIGEGRTAVIDHVIHHEDESTESVARYLDATEGLPVVHCAILNMRDADSKADFEMWYGFTDENGEKIGGRTRERLLANGGFEIIMPKLASGAASRIKRYGLTFEAACSDKRLTVAQRAQVSRWYQEMTKAILDNQPFRKLYGI
ncbi:MULTISPECIES: hypothetical protein [unclassified Rhizobium]|uniref:hypothetical protein n=1 Tax=unclassified Rhizobium TaxID=2613769 RepID=UPI0007EAEBD2|nr:MULTISPECIES: hypothetical protein [unclassified Rhizobium]ANL11964.1 hypothetical protein AMJ98_PA00018 [Rhizobium sp. N1341]ANM42809.1 hypothetical protein AMK03_PA00018 [Rhizobium sp. N741]